jgi:hypothetical protein
MNLYRGVFFASLMLLITFGNSQADNLGRLFTTPQERAELDNNSGTKLANRGDGNHTSAQKIILNGTVISSAGKRNIWINGKIHTNNPNEPEAQIINSKQVKLDTPYGSQSHVMKPGQILNLDDWKVYEAFMLEHSQADKSKSLNVSP